MAFVYKINCILKTWASLKKFKISHHSLLLKAKCHRYIFLGRQLYIENNYLREYPPFTWKQGVKCTIYWNIYSVRDFCLAFLSSTDSVVPLISINSRCFRCLGRSWYKDFIDEWYHETSLGQRHLKNQAWVWNISM